MGCGVECPMLPIAEDWGLEDPVGLPLMSIEVRGIQSSITCRGFLLRPPTLRKVSLDSTISHECSVVVITGRCQRLNPGSNPGTRTKISGFTYYVVRRFAGHSNRLVVTLHQYTLQLDLVGLRGVNNPVQIVENLVSFEKGKQKLLHQQLIQ